MIKKALLISMAVVGLLVGFAAAMMVSNPAPAVPAITAQDAAAPTKPYVVKLHARWCAVCMVTKKVWSEIEAAYATRVNLVVFDFTTQAASDASRAEARRIGLEKFFDESSDSTGTILVLDGRTREVTAAIFGSRDFAEYREAIDAALKAAAK